MANFTRSRHTVVSSLRELGIDLPDDFDWKDIDVEGVDEFVERIKKTKGTGDQGNQEMLYVHASSLATENSQVPPRAPLQSTPPGLSPVPATAVGYAQHGIQSGEGLQLLTQGDESHFLRQTLRDYSDLPEAVWMCTQDIGGGKLPTWAIGAFEMPLTVADIVSNKGEVYTKRVWDDNIPRLQNLAQAGKLVGKLDHPTPGQGVLGGLALKFQDIFWGNDRADGGKELWSHGYILKTQGGRDLATMLDAGIPVDVSSRGFGRTTPSPWNGRSAQIVQSFICDGFDAVLDGASPGAGFKAGRMWQDADGPLAETYEEYAFPRLERIDDLEDFLFPRLERIR